MPHTSSNLPLFFDRLHTLAAELRAHSPEWADRLEQVRTEHELRTLVCDLFNLSHVLAPHNRAPSTAQTLPARITAFISDNLHRGMSLKVLAQFLGYSEKYCSDLFAKMMGEPFSTYLRRYRVELGSTLLRTSGQTLAEIAASLGFSDQFAFSHFFKRATGHSPLQLRMLSIRQQAR
ncbi:MAG: helix-turn-helix transcriptional regulator [Nitrospira sp.]|nr:helix-turn-helix transcriptional regulator [Nitrospira sp.]